MNNNSGFTLIELLITTALTVLLMLGITSMFMTFLLGNSKTNTRKTVKEEGSYALSQMEFLLKNAHYIDETINGNNCQDNMTEIDIVSLDGGTTTLGTIETPATSGVMKIASGSDGILDEDSIALTSDSVLFINGEELLFDCSGPVGNRQVKINFGLSKITPDGTVTESFSSNVNIRN